MFLAPRGNASTLKFFFNWLHCIKVWLLTFSAICYITKPVNSGGIYCGNLLFSLVLVQLTLQPRPSLKSLKSTDSPSSAWAITWWITWDSRSSPRENCCFLVRNMTFQRPDLFLGLWILPLVPMTFNLDAQQHWPSQRVQTMQAKPAGIQYRFSWSNWSYVEDFDCLIHKFYTVEFDILLVTFSYSKFRLLLSFLLPESVQCGSALLERSFPTFVPSSGNSKNSPHWSKGLLATC